jgi:phosphatidylserine/phosphatidylglycerophosphate/cardiolipin synthase-like enzyme
MRVRNANGPLSVRAICGPHVVILAWDVREADWDGFTNSLLGFAIERSEFKNGHVVERYFIRGIKRFEEKDKGLAPGTPVPTSEHPIQSFQWGDYTARPGHQYQYRIVPVYGVPKLLELRDNAAVNIDVSTPEAKRNGHSVYFNRGAASSQAYAREFPDPKPDETKPESRQMKWLSRGLYEALIAFIGRANGTTFALRGALYEFHYLPVGKAVKQASQLGADVKILFDQPNYGAKNRAMITKAGIGELCKARTGNDSEKHNKFFVLLEDNIPVAVWTGSTNISAGGIFGHSNVGHVVFDRAIAQQYLEYWNFLWDRPDVGNADLAARNTQASQTPTDSPPLNSITALFSPREATTLQWYADRMDKAREIVCFTVAFTIAAPFATVLKKQNDVTRYVLKDKNSAGDDDIRRDDDLLIAAGAKFGKNDLVNFKAEELTGFNKNLYIHDKFLLIDPLSDDPIVITGSANFSPTSTTKNDENMLIIRGNTDVADAYFGEFMRLFDHIYARYIITKKLSPTEKKKRRGFLAVDNSWVVPHHTGPKARRRQRFHGPWS